MRTKDTIFLRIEPKVAKAGDLSRRTNMRRINSKNNYMEFA